MIIKFNVKLDKETVAYVESSLARYHAEQSVSIQHNLQLDTHDFHIIPESHGESEADLDEIHQFIQQSIDVYQIVF